MQGLLPTVCLVDDAQSTTWLGFLSNHRTRPVKWALTWTWHLWTRHLFILKSFSSETKKLVLGVFLKDTPPSTSILTQHYRHQVPNLLTCDKFCSLNDWQIYTGWLHHLLPCSKFDIVNVDTWTRTHYVATHTCLASIASHAWDGLAHSTYMSTIRCKKVLWSCVRGIMSHRAIRTKFPPRN